jgi:ribosomal protein S18 acetylase RimI-like enzyme
MLRAMRQATALDLPALVRLVNSGYRGDTSRRGWTTEADLLDGQRTDPDSLAQLLARPASAVLLHEDLSGLQGCVHVERTAGESDAQAYIGMLTVQPDGQRAGLGSLILHAAEQYAREHWRACAACMTVIAQRPELIDWYRRRGYQRTSEVERFPYGDARFGLPKRDDLYFVVLRKSLLDE